MKLLIMPAGEFDNQSKTKFAIDRLKNAGAKYWAIQAVMPKSKKPKQFLSWSSKLQINRINHKTLRRSKIIPSNEIPIILDYEIDLKTIPANEHAAALVRVKNALYQKPIGLYALGTERHSISNIKQIIKSCEFTQLNPSAYYRRGYDWSPPNSVQDDIKLAFDLGIEPVPYIHGRYVGQGGGALVPKKKLNIQIDTYKSLGVKQCIVWGSITSDFGLESIENILSIGE